MVARLINKFHALRDKHLLRLPPRAANPYLTHIPILLAAARWRPLRAVLEFGCGEISTPAFLDRRYFPQLRRLESYENNATWAERVRHQVGTEPRLNLHLLDGAVASFVDAMELEQFDLILIDDSVNSDERSATIRSVAAKRPVRPIVAVHDFEVPPYRAASRPFRHRFRFTALNPNTGLLWNDGSVTRSVLRQAQPGVASLWRQTNYGRLGRRASRGRSFEGLGGAKDHRVDCGASLLYNPQNANKKHEHKNTGDRRQWYRWRGSGERTARKRPPRGIMRQFPPIR